LNAPDDSEIDSAIPSLRTNLQRRSIHLQFRHFADVFDIDVVADESRMTVIANRNNGSAGFEIDGSTTRWAVDLRHRSGEALISAPAFADADVRGTQRGEENGLPVQRSSWNTAEDVDAGGSIFGKCVNRKMRFLQKPNPRYSAAFRKSMPDGFANRSQFHAADNFFEQLRQLRLVPQSCVGAAKGFNEPLNASHRI
jgi:hypothetical protein